MRILVIAALSLHIATAVHAQDVAADEATSYVVSGFSRTVTSSSSHDRWDAVRALPAGARLEIEDLAGGFLEGRVRSVSDDAIAIDTKKATVDVMRSSVGRVVFIGARRTGRGARRGFLIGAAIGAAVTAIGRAPVEWILFIGSSWGGLGAALGAADGARTRERVVIYQAARSSLQCGLSTTEDTGTRRIRPQRPDLLSSASSVVERFVVIQMPQPPDLKPLLTILDQAYDHRSWHGTNLRGSIRGLSLKQAAWRPAEGRHNIWELVVHSAYWKYAARRRLTGEGRQSFPLKGSNWFERPIETTESAWRSDIALLDDMHRSLRDAIANLPPATLHQKNGAGKDTNFSLIAGVAAHDLYHAGQIQLLKRLARTR